MYQEALQLVSHLTAPEKARLLQWIVSDMGNAFPGIEHRAEVAGGDACIVRTRIPVWLLVQARREAQSDAIILTAYPQLRAEDIANAWAYYHAHREEIDHAISENEKA
jgi:uncharacterized protein (DUF433 family)